MLSGQPSRTARGAAAHRATHQVIEGGAIFADPLALRILGEDAGALARDAEENPLKRAMRLFVVARARFAEDALAAAVERGVRQLVILGAGLDTFAYRNAFGDRIRVFEVDHPATQGWKRQRLAEAGIAIPPALTFAPIDFERETLAQGLAAAGFSPALPSFFTWLGVVPYLSETAVFATLGYIGSLPGGAHVVFDYGEPPASLPPELRARIEQRAAQVAALGEAWITYFEPDALHARMRELGFAEIEDLGLREIVARYIPSPGGTATSRGGHIIRGATPTPA